MLRPYSIAAGIFVCALTAQVEAVSEVHSLAGRVKDGPAATVIRESYDCLEQGEASNDDAVKLKWYDRGKGLAEKAIQLDDRDADAHFAMFANWGRWLQTDGWVKNAFQLPALWRELDRSLELEPNHPDALAAKGGLYLQLPGFLGGDLGKAEPLLLRSIAVDPNAVGARLELADCYLQQNRPAAARELATTALRLALAQHKQRFVARATALIEQIGPPTEHAEAKR